MHELDFTEHLFILNIAITSPVFAQLFPPIQLLQKYLKILIPLFPSSPFLISSSHSIFLIFGSS